jgi:N-acetylmuramoyl-L-alanine amidase
MLGRLIALALALALALPQTAAAAPSAAELYAAGLQLEEVGRTAMQTDDEATALGRVHAAVAAYREVVRRYPTSGYSDNALWQAGCLLLDAYGRFGRVSDREAGERLLRWLQREYPSSRLVSQVDGRIQGAASREEPAAPETTRASDGLADQPADHPLVTIAAIRRTVLPESIRITIDMDGEVPFHDERIGSPDRVFLDLPFTRVAPELLDRTIRFETDADVVRQVRIGRHPNHTTRIVLDAANVATYSVYAMYDPYRLVIDCARAGTLAAGAGTAPRPWTPRTFGHPAAPRVLAGQPRGAAWVPLIAPQAPPGRLLLADADATGEPAAVLEAAPAPVGARPSSLPSAPPRNLDGGFSIARQLGLGVSRIVIDPGHGGHDPGATARGVTEADVVLDVALRLEKLLKKVPGVEVILTRRTDEYIPLPERTAMANREGADLFLSIHANASARSAARGVETYFLNFAENQSAAAVAARENAASSQAMGELPDLVKAIALNNKLDESRDFATMIQQALVARLRPANHALRDLGVKQAPFVVLIGAAMPSVLAEISFLTNPQDARLLRAGAYRQRIAEALFDAIRKYQTSLKGVTAVAQQR